MRNSVDKSTPYQGIIIRFRVIPAAMLMFAAMPDWADKAEADKLEARKVSLRELLGIRAVNGIMESPVQLADMLEQSIGGPADIDRADDLYVKAALSKNSNGLRRMCYAYLKGVGRPFNVGWDRTLATPCRVMTQVTVW